MVRGKFIVGTNNDDTLIGSDSNDIIISGRGDDIVNAGDGNDFIHSISGNNTIDSGDGSDFVITGRGNDTINSGNGRDVIISKGGNNAIDGGDGSDFIRTGYGDDTIKGGGGRDVIKSRGGDNTIDGGEGSDFVLTGYGDDDISGGSGHDIILSGGGDDIAAGGAGCDYLNLGRGNDTAIYVANENTADRDFYNGGRGCDTLRLVLTRQEWLDPKSQADIAAFLAFTNNSHGTYYSYYSKFYFESFGLTVKSFEKLEVVVDGDFIDPTDELATAISDQFEIAENGHLSANVLDNDIVPDLIANVELVDDVAKGTLVFNPDGSFGFDANGEFDHLALGEKATETFTYKVIDADGDEDTATVTISITGANDVPIVGFIDAGTTHEDAAPLTIDLLAKAIDVDASDDLDTQSVAIVSSNGGRTVAFIVNNKTGALAIEPGQFNDLAVGASETLTVTYDVIDGNGGVVANSATLIIEGRNDDPVVQVLLASTASEDDTVQVVNLLPTGAILDADLTDVLSVVQGTLTQTGGRVLTSAQLNSNTLTYNPNEFNKLAESESEVVTFTYEVTDNNGGTVTPTITLTINGVNDAAVITGVSEGTIIEDAAPNSVSGVLNAADVDNPDDSFQAVANGIVATTNAYGTYAVNAAGVWTYTLDNSNGAVNALNTSDSLTDSFTVHTEDGTAQTVKVTINGANDAPEAADQTFTIGQNSTLDRIALSQSDVDAGDQLSDILTIIDPNPKSPPKGGGDAEFVIGENESRTIFQPSRFNGLLTNHDDGTFSFDTDGDYKFIGEGETFEVNFTYTVTDLAGETDTASVTITIEGKNDAPVSTSFSPTIVEDGFYTQNSSGGYDDDDNDIVTYIVVDGPAHASVFEFDSVVGAYTYIPEANFNGVDSFTFKMNDGRADSNISTVNITVTPVNDAAEITGQVVGMMAEDAALNTVSGDLNSTDVDNTDDAFQVVANGAVATANGFGTYAVTAAGVWTYSLDNANAAVNALSPSDSLTDSFVVLSEDGTAQTVDITIAGTNDVAAITGLAEGTIAENATPNTVSGDLNSVDVDNTDDAFQAVANGAVATANGFGTYAVTAAGVWTYTLDNANAAVNALNVSDSLTDSFTVLSEDGTAQTVVVTINGANDEAIITGDALDTIREGVSGVAGGDYVTGKLDAVDIDNPDDAFQALKNGMTANGYGNYSVKPSGEWTYTLDNNNQAVDALNFGDTLTDSFTVLSEDGTAQAVEITITGTNDRAIITGQATGAVTEDATANTVSGDLNASDVDNADDAFQVVANGTVATANGYGTYAVNAAGVWTYALDNANAAVDVLNNNDTLSDSFTVFSEDGTAQVVDITINGTNDAAVITGDATSTIREGVSGIAGATIVTGNLDAVDVDNPDDAFQAVKDSATANGYGTFSVKSSGVWIYTLDNDNPAVDGLNLSDTLTDNFTVLSEDGTAQMIEVTITGVNDRASITGQTIGTIAEDAAPNTVSGDLNSTDIDNTDDAFQVVANGTVATANGFGTYAVTAAGVWTYTLNNANAAVNALGTSSSLTDSFTVLSEDGTTKAVDITITGTNDAPVVAVIDAGSVSEDDASVTIDLLAGQTDPDTNDTLSATNIVATDDQGQIVNFTNNIDGTITIDPNQYDALNAGENRAVTVTYGVSDGAISTQNTASLTVIGATDNLPPVAADDEIKSVSEFLVNEFTNGAQDAPRITTLSNGRFVVTWSSDDPQQGEPSGTNIKARIFDASGTEIVSEFLINQFATGVFPDYDPTPTSDIAALSNGGFVVTWFSYDPQQGDTEGTGIKARIFDANGTEIGSEFLVNENTSGYQLFPSIAALSNGNFVVAWETPNPFGGSGNVNFDIHRRTFDASGNEVMSEIEASELISDFQSSPSITALSNGGYVVVWEAYELLPNHAIFTHSKAAVFDAVGDFVTLDFQLDEFGSQSPSITALSNGGFVVTWHSDGIKGRIFNADGAEAVSEFQVNEFANGFQRDPNITALSDGGFVVTWISRDTQGNDGVKGRIFNADGTEAVSEFLVSEFNNGYQTDPNITALSDGGFAVTWTSSVPQQGDTSGTGIKARIFDANGTPQSGQVILEDDVSTIQQSELLANDTDPDGDPLSITDISATSTKGAVLTLNNDGTISYDPTQAAAIQALADGESTSDTFTYTVSDGKGGEDTATVTLTVKGQNDAAVITGWANGTITEDAAPNTVSGDLNSTDVDDTDDAFQAVADGAVVTANGYGTYAVDAAGVWIYTLDNGNAVVDALNTNETLNDSFTVFSEDGTAKTVEITVNGSDDSPVAADDTGSATEAGGINNGTVGSDAAGNVLANDTGKLTLEVTQIRSGEIEGAGTAGVLGAGLAGAFGTLTLDANGGYIYVVDNDNGAVQALNITGANTSLTDTFNYTLSDGSITDTAVLTITINGANDAPVVQPLSLNVEVNQSVDGVLIGNDVDGDDASLIYQRLSSPDRGEVSGGLVDGNNASSFTYTAPRRAGGEDVTFTYRTVDDHGAASEPTTVTITINATSGGVGSEEGGNSSPQLVKVAGTLDDETLTGTAKNEQFIGNGGNDTFIFEPGFGADRIDDFDSGAGVGDVVEFQGLPASDYTALQTYMNDFGGPDTVIDFGGGDSLTLQGVTLADLDADDFRFVV